MPTHTATYRAVAANNQLGEMYKFLGQLGGAHRVFSLALAITKAQSKAEPNNPSYVSQLADSYMNLGDESLRIAYTRSRHQFHRYV